MSNRGNWYVPQLTRKDGEVIKIWDPMEAEWPEVMAILKKFNEDNIFGDLKKGISSTEEIMLVAGNRSKSNREASMYKKMLSESEFIEAKGKQKEFEDYLKKVV